ncbi:hypothetical protein BOH66_02825 [Microbacterium aurum]|uniref:Major facilitator superfamily (MFS) profile domain-containing protein n=1 Tax=Microbacterium aurum TaxID=36805 RepID=A0A1P8U5F1_9MICO|nr:hypothetical protein BOH66_02825 [Microbacterium aurum]
MPRLVPTATLTSANSQLYATSTMLNSFVGPPVAGLLIGISTVLTAVTGGALYALAALSCLFLLRSLDQPGHQRESHADDHGRVRDGLAFLWRHVLLRQLAILTAVMNLVWGAWTALFVIYAIAPGPLNLDPVAYGGLITAMSVGGIAASIAAPLLRRVFSVPTLLFADLVGTVLLVLPAAMGGPLWTVVAGIVAAGAGASLWSVLVAVLRQERTPPALLGRVYSASRVLSWGALPLGSALAAFLAHWLDVGQILGAAAVLAIMMAAWFPLLRITGTLQRRRLRFP